MPHDPLARPDTVIATPGLKASVLLLATVLSLLGCAGETREDEPLDEELLGAPACFYPRDVQDFRVIDRSRLIVLAPNDSRAYQVRISPPSSALRNASRLRFDSRNGQICGRAGESIYFDSVTSIRYVVMDVRRLDRLSVEMIVGGDKTLEAQDDAAAEIEPLPGDGSNDSDNNDKAGQP